MFQKISLKRTNASSCLVRMLVSAIATHWAFIGATPVISAQDSIDQLELNAQEERKLSEAESLFESAWSSFQSDDPSTHENAFRRAQSAIRLQGEIIGGDHPRLMNPLVRLSKIYLDAEQERNAYNALKRADDIYESSCKGKLLLEMNDWGSYSTVEPFEYPVQSAVSIGRLEQLRTEFSKSDRQSIATLMREARFYVYQEYHRHRYLENNVSEAISRLQAMISLVERDQSAEPWQIAELQHQLGLILWADGKPILSLAQFRSAAETMAELWKKQPVTARADIGTPKSKDKLPAAIAKFGLGLPVFSMETNTSIFSGQSSEYFKTYQIATTVLSECLGESHPSSIKAMNNYGFVHYACGDFETAEEIFSRAADASSKCAANHFFIREALLHNYAAVLMVKGKPQEAAVLLKDVDSESVVRAYAAILYKTPEDSTIHLQQRLDHEFNFAVSMAVVENASEVSKNNAAKWLANGKGIRTRALGTQNRLVYDEYRSKKTNKIRELIRNRTLTANLAIDTSWKGPDWLRINAIRLRERHSHREIADFAKTVDSSVPKLNYVGLRDIRKQIREGEVLIDFARFRQIDFRTIGSTEEREYYAACIIRSDSEQVIWLNLGLASEIDPIIEHLRRSVQFDIARRLSIDGEANCVKQLIADSKTLVERIWAPIEKNIGDAKNLTVSPASQLWLIPWAALPIEENEKTSFLLEKYKLRFLTNLSKVTQTSSVEPKTAAVIFADPDFDLTPRDKQATIQRLTGDQLEIEPPFGSRREPTRFVDDTKRLGTARQEANQIRRALDNYQNAESISYLGSNALDYIARKLDSPVVLHFATHAFYIPTQNRLPKARMFTNQFDRTKSLTKSALFRCGLLLAGCNQAESYVGGDDGVLTGIEVTGINLTGTDLVVLSACGTGDGEVENGDGVSGLRQAFFVAGVNSVVASLWHVEDRETTLLMIKMYNNLEKGLSKSEALRQAQLSRIKARRARHGAAHPFFWAAFTLTGQD